MADGTTHDSAINVETYGSGPRQVVALHCSLGRAASWAAIARAFGDDITLTAPDFPGHGKSGPWARTGLMREAAVALTDDVVGSGPVDLIGHSYGAIVALDFATRHPDRVRSLTLIEPIFLAIAGQDDRAVLDAYLAQMQPHLDALAAGRNEEAARLFMEIWGGGVEWDKLPEPARAGLTRQVPVVDACKPGDEASPAERRVMDGLTRLTMPVAILYGSATLPVVKLVQTGLKARLPRAKLIEVAGAGHMVPLTHADAICDELRMLWAL